MTRRVGVVAACVVILGGACAPSGTGARPTSTTSPPASQPSAPELTPAATARPARPTRSPSPRVSPSPSEVVEVRYRIERRTDHPGTDGFETFVRQTLEDPRGWQRAGFDLVHDTDAPHVVVLAEGPTVDELCHPYDTGGRYSCQIGPVVALNADRWRNATPRWTGDLETYRRYLVNHEVGHLLGLHHPTPQCPGEGLPAAIMSQQSTELGGCRPNGWPLDWEIELAARHELPLTPGYEPDVEGPTDPRSTSGGD